jgi:hypothetical protein
MPAKMKDGTPIKLRFEDKGNAVPAFDEHGNRYDAYTSWFRAESPDFEENPEIYSQVSIKEAIASGNEAAFRVQNDDLCLESIGVDLGSIDLDGVEVYNPTG